MTEGLSKPVFLGERYNPEIDPTFTEGSITTVRYLDVLPPNILERVPSLAGSETGYVLKQYNREFDPNYSKHDLTIFSPDTPQLSSQDPKKFTIVDKATILKRRQDELQRYFGNSGKDIIIPSDFFIAKNEDAEFSLYEIQKRVSDYHTLEKVDSIDFDSINEAQKESLLAETKELLRILSKLLVEEEDATFKTFIPDFHSDNIAITNDGHVRIFDTNFWGFQWSGFVPDKVKRSVQMLTTLIKRLENVLNKK